MILPIAVLKSLHMSMRQKIGLAFVFALVLIIVAIDILRTVYTLDMDLKQGQDANALWGVLEPTIAVIVCALPCYRGILNLHTGMSISSISQSTYWSRIFKSRSSVSKDSRDSRNESKEEIVMKEFSTEGKTRNHPRY